jgi:hypothetical protein
VPDSSWTIVGAVTHAPGVPEQATAVLVSPVAAASVRIAPVTLDGPLFVTVTVYVVVPPAVTLLAPFVFVIERSADGVTVSVSVAELFPGVGSVVPPGTAMVATFETLPLVAVTLAVTVIW